MSVRLLLASVLTLALLGAAIPVIEQANQARATHALEDSTARLETAMSTLERHNDPVPLTVPGARRQLEIDIPDTNTANRLVIVPEGSTGYPASDQTAIIVSRVGTGERHVEPLDVDIATLEAPQDERPSKPLTIREDTTITLGYHRIDGVSRVTITRGFKGGDGTNPSHAESTG